MGRASEGAHKFRGRQREAERLHEETRTCGRVSNRYHHNRSHRHRCTDTGKCAIKDTNSRVDRQTQAERSHGETAEEVKKKEHPKTAEESRRIKCVA